MAAARGGPRPWGGARRARGRAAWLALLLGAGGLAAAQPSPGALPGPAAALAERAALAAEAGDWLLVRELAAAGLELEGSSSDLRLLGARALLALGEGAGAALPELEAALAAARFGLFDPEEAALLRAGLLVETRRFPEALALLDPGPPPGRGLALRPEFRLLRAKAFYGLGNLPAARRELEEGLRRFPAEPRFARLFFEREAAPPSAEARRLGEAFLARLPVLSAADPELRLLSLPYLADRVRRRDGLLAYRAEGGSSPLSTLLALEEGLLSPEAAVEDFLGLPGPLSLSHLWALRARLEEGEEGRAGLARLAEGLRAWSGAMGADRDGDGRKEESFRYEGGHLRAWSLDIDQDGRPERELGFAEGLPSEARVEAPGLVLTFSYSSYPRLAELLLSPRPTPPLLGSGGDSGPGLEPPRSYRYGAEAPSLPLLELSSFPFPGSGFYLPQALDFSLPAERELAALALDRRRSLPDSEELLLLDRGIPLRREEYREGRLLARLEYERGLPRLERVDLDGDGRFETERLWGDPASPEEPDRLRMDLDGDGAFEYRESLRPPFRKEWDYGGDGLPDAAESLGPEGWRLREFSTRLDGSFDLRLLFDEAGGLVSAQREGRELPILPDANPRLRWLGSKPFDLGSNLPEGEGVYRHMGIRYRLIYAGAEAFAEPLP